MIVLPFLWITHRIIWRPWLRRRSSLSWANPETSLALPAPVSQSYQVDGEIKREKERGPKESQDQKVGACSCLRKSPGILFGSRGIWSSSSWAPRLLQATL
jgi:hypothetical protein